MTRLRLHDSVDVNNRRLPARLHGSVVANPINYAPERLDITIEIRAPRFKLGSLIHVGVNQVLGMAGRLQRLAFGGRRMELAVEEVDQSLAGSVATTRIRRNS